MRWTLLALLAAACTPTIAETQLNPIPSTAHRRAPEQVEVLASGPPTRPHVDVAILTTSRGPDWAEVGIADLRTRAGELGCDAIVVTQELEHGYAQLSATCVAYTR